MELDIISMGAASALGLGVGAHEDFIKGKRSFVFKDLIQTKESGKEFLPVLSAGKMDFSKKLKNPKTAKFFSREMILAFLAADEASQAIPLINKERFGVVLATAPPLGEISMVARIKEMCVVDGVLQPALLAKDIPFLIPAIWPFRCIKATGGCHLAMELNLLGPNITLAPSIHSALNAFQIANLLLKSNSADVVFAGASDSRINEVAIGAAVLKRKLRQDNKKILEDSFAKGFSEGAAIFACSRIGEFKNALARVIISQDILFAINDKVSSLRAILKKLTSEVLEKFSGRNRIGKIWICFCPDLFPENNLSVPLLEQASLLTETIDVNRQFGWFGHSAPALATLLALFETTNTSDIHTILVVNSTRMTSISVGIPYPQ